MTVPLPSMTVAEYAAHRRCSDSYVRRLKREGRLVLDPQGRIDVARSDAKLADTTDPLRGGDRTGKSDARADYDPLDATVGGDLLQAGSAATISLREAVRRERLARARMAELELGEESGDLIRKRAAARDVFTMARQAMERLQSLPSLLRGRLAAESEPAACEALLRTEIDKVCADMRKAAETMAAAPQGEQRGEAEAA